MDQDIRPMGSTGPSQPAKPDNDAVNINDLNQVKPSEMVEPSETSIENQALDSAEAGAPADIVQSTPTTAPVVDKPTEVKMPVAAKMPKPKSGILKTVIFVIVALVISGASAGAAYYYRDMTATDEISKLKQDKQSLQDQLDAAKSDGTAGGENGGANAGGSSSTASIAPSQVVIESMKASITSGNTAALEGYMAETVSVVLAASESGGLNSPTDAVASVTSFIDGVPLTTGNWDFALATSVLDGYAAGDYAQYFNDTSVVGKSTTGKVIAFSFDGNSKISTVFMSASADLLN